MKGVVLFASYLSLGIALYLGSLNLRAARLGDRASLWYGLTRIGFIIIVGLITEAIQRNGIAIQWRVILYVIALVLSTIGFIGIAVDHRRARAGKSPFWLHGIDIRREEEKGEPND